MLNFSFNSLFSGKSGGQKQEYHVDLEFLEDIVPEVNFNFLAHIPVIWELSVNEKELHDR